MVGNPEWLTLAGLDPVPLNESYRLCAQCHFIQVEAWSGGAHGKRLDTWRGPRVVMNCTDCHNPHDPGIPGGGQDVRPLRVVQFPAQLVAGQEGRVAGVLGAAPGAGEAEGGVVEREAGHAAEQGAGEIGRALACEAAAGEEGCKRDAQ